MKAKSSHIYGAIAFLALLVGLLEALNYWLIPLEPNYDKDKYGLIYNFPYEPEIVVLGSSHALRGINPKEMTDFRVLNFALDGTGPTFHLQLYQHILKGKLPNSLTILIQVDWFFQDPNWLWRRIEHDARFLSLPDFVSLLVFGAGISSRELLQNRYEIFNWEQTLRTRIKVPNYSSREASGLGYVGFPSLNFSAPEHYFHLQSPHESYSFNQLESLGVLIDEIRSDGHTAILIQTPEYREAIFRRHGGAKQLEHIAKQKNIPFLNYNRMLSGELNERFQYYDDWGHLSLLGAKIFSQRLNSDMKEFFVRTRLNKTN